MVQNTNALSNAVNQQAAAARAVQAPVAGPAPAQATNAQGLTAQQMAEFAQTQQDRRYANAAEVARINNISLDEARARIDRATAAQSGEIRTPEGAYYNPDTGRYSTDIYSIGRDPNYHPSAAMGVMASTIEGAYGREPLAGGQGETGAQTVTGTTDASGRATLSPARGSLGVSGQAAGAQALPYQGELDRLNRESDELQRKYMEDFEKMRNGQIPLTESQQMQLDTIKLQFDQLIRDQKVYNENYTQMTNLAGVVSGRNRYAPEIAMGQMKKTVDDGLARITELNVKAINTMFEVKNAMQQENWKNLDASYTKLDQFMQRRQKTIQDMQDRLLDQAEKVKAANRQAEQDKFNYSKEVAPGLADGLTYLKSDGSIYQPTEDEITAAAKQSGIDAGILRSNVQKQISKIREDQKKQADKELESLNKDKRDLLDSAAKNAAPQSVINAINKAKTYAEAIQAGGDYLANASGIIGEYNFYKRQEENAGRVPMSFNAFQDADANRKKAVSQQGRADGLSDKQLSTIQQQANSFKTETAVKEFQEVQNGKDFIDSTPEKATSTDAIGLIYAFAKVMDPGSVVREGEYNTVQKYAQSWTDTLGVNVTRILSGKDTFVKPDAIKRIKDTISRVYDSKKKAYDNVRNEYIRTTQEYTGVDDVEKYFRDYSTSTAQSVQGAQKELDDFYVANPGKQGQIDALAADPRNFTDEQILQIMGASDFSPVGGDAKPATREGNGSLSAKFESSGDPGAIGYDTTGGYSYGKYQLAHDNARKFVEQSPYARDFAGIAFNSPQFRAKWQEVAKRDPQGFAQAQQRYIEQTHMKPQEEKLAAAGFDIAKASSVLKDVIFSTAVQHGPANAIILTALKRVGMGAPEEKLIRAIYDARWNGGKNFASSTKKVQKAVYNRFFGKNGELQTALSRIA